MAVASLLSNSPQLENSKHPTAFVAGYFITCSGGSVS